MLQKSKLRFQKSASQRRHHYGRAANGSIRTHVVTLTDGHAVVAQNGVGRADVKEKLRQTVVGQVGLTT